MNVQNHPHRQDVIETMTMLEKYLEGVDFFDLLRQADYNVRQTVTVIFDDVNKPFVPDTMRRLRRIVAEHTERYRNGHSEEGAVLANDLERLGKWLADDNGKLCGECLFYPWFRGEFMNRYKDDDIRREAERIRRLLLDTTCGYNIAGTYNHRTKTITLYTQNVANNQCAYASVFAHEYFHALHHELLDEAGCDEPLDRYYHTVVLETLATRFQIDFMQWLEGLVVDGATEESTPLLGSVMRNTPIFYPYSGAKYAYEQPCRQPSMHDALMKTMLSFEDALRALIPDNYEVEIILRKRPPVIRGIETPQITRRNNLSMTAPTGYAPSDVISGAAIYRLPHNENVFRGMVEDGHPFGALVRYVNGEVAAFGPIYDPNCTGARELYVYLTSQPCLFRGVNVESVTAYVIW